MNRAGLVLLGLLVPLAFATGQTPAQPSVFVDTEPMGARIVVDGKLVAETTPALLRGLTPGSHRIDVGLDDYQTVGQTVEIPRDRVTQVSVALTPTSVVLAFPAEPNAGNQYWYPQGTYSFQRLGSTLVVTPVFPDETLAALSGWSFVALTGVAAISTGIDLYRSKHGDSDGFGPVTVGLWVSALLDLPWVASVQGRKARFSRETAPRLAPTVVPVSRAPELFDAGERALATGDLDQAAVAFGQLVEQAPKSRLVPGAWFRLARIHAATGHQELAQTEYRLVAETYPQAETYDRARKALADLYAANGSPAKAVEQLDLMALNDDYFTAADLAAQRAKLSTQEAPVGP